MGGGLAQGPPVIPPGQRLDQFAVIQPGRLAPALHKRLTAIGTRLQKSETGRVTYAGAITDERGQRPVEIVIQNPGSVRISEAGASTRVTSFNGTRVNTASGPLAEDAARLLLTFATDSPEAIFQQLAAGEAYRSIGARHLLTGPTAVGRPPEYVDLYQLLPRGSAKTAIPGAAGAKTVAFDSVSGLLRFVSYHNAANTVVTTQYEDWKAAGSEKYPSTIRRLEGGREVFRVAVQSISLGAPVANGIF